MNAQEKLYDTLINDTNVTQYVGDRIFPLTFKKDGEFPVIVYEVVDTDYHNSITNDDLTDADGYIMINIISKSYGGVQIINKAVIESLKANSFIINSGRDYHEEQLDLFGKQLTVQVHASI